MRLADLGDWSSREPGPALRLIEVFAPREDRAEPHPEQQMEQQIQKLGDLLSWAGDTPEAARARFDRGSLYLMRALGRKREGVPFERWREDTERAQADLAGAAADPALQPAVARARGALESIVPAAPSETQTAERPAVPAVKQRPVPRFYRADLGKVEDFWKDGFYDAALHELNIYIAQNPRDEAGRAWRDRIAAAQRLEKNYRGK
jgi:hypothetical protein